MDRDGRPDPSARSGEAAPRESGGEPAPDPDASARGDRGPAELFDALAGEYDEMRREIGWDPFPHVSDALGTRTPVGMRVLDLGCGSGEVLAWFASRGADVVGIDVSDEMCALAAARVPEALIARLDVSDGIPFGDRSFDLVMAQGCLEYMPAIEQVLDEMVRVTRPDGIVLAQVELCGPDLPDGPARTVRFLDDWVRHRRTRADVAAWVADSLPGAAVEDARGYVLEDSGERVVYARIIGRPDGEAA